MKPFSKRLAGRAFNARRTLLALAALGASFSAAHSHAQATPVWAEEFNAATIDKNIWTYKVGGDGNGNGELQFYTSTRKNSYIEDGKLVIQALRESYQGKQFTSARLHTNGRFSFKYGTLEARMKLPKLANGLWPAFWMLGTNFGLDGWPKSGEWDILEAGYKSAQTDGTVDKAVSGAMHWWHESGTWSTWLQADASSSYVMPTNFYDDYHTYKLDWTPAKVTMYVDGTQYFTMDISDPNMSEFRDNPASIILNLAVGGFNFVELTDPAQITAPFPAKMYVDYIRLYPNANTQTFVAGNNLPTGNFGISTETTPTINQLNWGDRTNLYIWNNMTTIATTPSEGSGALAYNVKAGSWWGMGLVHKDYNMRNYTHGYMHLDIKTTTNTTLGIGISSTSGGDGKVQLVSGGDEYGLVRDGNWHHVAIPLSKFGNVDFETIKAFFSIFGDAPSADFDLAVDNIYLTPSIEIPAPEMGSFGIYTETPSHKNAGEFGFGVNGDLFLWDNTLTLEQGTAREGNAALNLKSTGKGWFGLGLTAREGFNLSAFDNASAVLHISLKTADQTSFQLGFKSGNVNDIGQKWIDFKPGADPYGFARDGQWHDLAIPFSEIGGDLDTLDVRQVLQVLGTGEVAALGIDDVYISGGTTAKPQCTPTCGVEPNRAPVASLKPSVLGGTSPLLVLFDASKSYDPNSKDTLTYSWDFGDGTTATGVSTSHMYLVDGSYKATLTVSDGKETSVVKTNVYVDKNYGKTKSAKRGVGYGNHSEEDMALMSKGISWWYNWSNKPDAAIINTYQNYGVEFVPMAWNAGFDEAGMRAYIASHPGVKYILAFNEPQFVDQANMTPTEVAAQWPRLEAIARDFNLKIVSEAMNYCGNCVKSPSGEPYYSPWKFLDDFFAICPTCRVDAISIHAYMPDVGGIEWYINEYKKYGKPIWLTEFCAWESTTTLETQKRMLIQVLDSLENNKDVERYAWFIGRSTGHPFNSLLDSRQSGVASELGSIYLNMPVHGDSNTHALPKLVEAEQYGTMSGIRVEETADVNGFLNLSDVAAGDWVEYNVTGNANTYNLAVRYASAAAGTVNVLVDGVQKAVINVGATASLQTWATANSSLVLTAGAHKVRFVFNQATNLNWVNFTVGGTSTSSSVATTSSVKTSSSVATSVATSSIATSSIATTSSVKTSSSVATTSSVAATSSVKTSSSVATTSSVATSSSVATTSSTGVVYGNLAASRPAVASSNEGEAWLASFATDANSNTRWASLQTDAQWIYVDLGASRSFNRVVLNWEGAYGKSYEIQTSNDATTWTKIYGTTTGVGGKETLNISGTGRYVRMFGIARGTGYGYSLWDFEVHNIAGASTSSSVATSASSSVKTSSSVATTSSTATTSSAVATSSSVASSVAAGTNLALNRPGFTSSNEGAGTAAAQALDGNSGTRWASQQTDAQWIYVDLGAAYSINKVVLNWEAAYGKAYEIQTSNDAVTWTKIYGTTTGVGGKETLNVIGSGRYVRLLGITRGTGYGYSLWDFEVYGAAAPAGNAALNKPAVASSNEGAGLAASFAVDGNTNTRWASLATDNQWIYVDLGSVRAITGVVLKWESAYGKAYNIQVSNDATTWTTIKSVTDGNGDYDDLPVTGSGRYVRVQGVTRGTGYGYSLWDFEVY